jgi:predicted ATPase
MPSCYPHDALTGRRARRVVLTGGPGAGKTAVLELVKRTLCEHVAVVPESASILFRGGFPRERAVPSECAAQRAIARVQMELESIYDARPGVEVAVCDRGTIDGLAYWPLDAESFFAEVGTTWSEQLARYDVVIHLEPPDERHGYHRDGTRIESAAEAREIDRRIVLAWSAHPRRYSVPSTPDFLDKARRVLALLEPELPAACREGHARSVDPRNESSAAQ